MQAANVSCAVCDHLVVDGVACDGVREECSAPVAHGQHRLQTRSFAVAVARATGESEFDCIRGID